MKFPYDIDRTRLVKAAKSRWYVEFYVWNPKAGSKGKFERFRDIIPKSIQDEKTREDFANDRIREINKALKDGFVVGPKEPAKPKPQKLEKEMNVQEALDYAIKHKKNTCKSVTKFKQVKTAFTDFLASKNPSILKEPITSINKKIILDFYDYEFLECKRTEYTRNGLKRMLKTLFQLLVDKDKITSNPVPKNKKLKTSSTKNRAYLPDQVKSLLNHFISNDPQLYIFVRTMFYTLARRNELRLLRIRDIDFTKEKIRIIKENSKNKLSRMIDISPHLLPDLKKMNLQNYPEFYYVFGKKGAPGEKPRGINFFSDRHKTLTEEFKLGPDFTLYSWKHTGVCEHFKAGVDLDAIKQQGGWEDWESFLTYIKSLGLDENKRFKEKSPKI
ncbi:MAG: tyrosine-type recombinase/integrase [Cytophagaceae bacterium]